MKEYVLPLVTALASCYTCAGPISYHYRILETQPHDKSLFTQGLIVEDQWIYESGGGYGRSRLLRYHKDSGKVDTRFEFPKNLFAEGATLFHGELFVLTWRAGRLLIYKTAKPKPQRQLYYQGEGWGLTHDGEMLIMSNGSDLLYFRDRNNFAIRRVVSVHDGSKRWKNLNELEFAHNKIWANIWRDNRILAISPEDGRVLGIADLSTLAEQNSKTSPENVLNGIAYDKQRRAFWITGKHWPQRYLVKFTTGTH